MKRLTIILVALSISASAFSQTRFAVEFGFNAAYITGMKQIYSQAAPFGGGFLGFQMKSQFNDLLGIRTGIGFGTQGVTTTYTSVKDVQFTMGTYLTVPVLLCASFVDDRLHIMAGPQLGVALSMKDYDLFDVNGHAIDGYRKWQPGTDYNVCDLSVDVCVQYLFTDNFGMKLQYNFGLTDVFNSIKIKGTTYDVRNCNYVGQLGFVYMFDEI